MGYIVYEIRYKMNFAIDFYLLLCFNGLLYGCKLNLSMSSVYKRNCSSFSPLSYIFQAAVCEEFRGLLFEFTEKVLFSAIPLHYCLKYYIMTVDFL